VSEVNLDVEKAYEAAAERGQIVVRPGSYDVQLDIDSEQDLSIMEGQLNLLRENGIQIGEVRRTTSRSGNKHVYLRLPRHLTNTERIALQATLGSDRKRELLSLLRVWGGNSEPTLLFENPTELN
jgi:hypothetical protein